MKNEQLANPYRQFADDVFELFDWQEGRQGHEINYISQTEKDDAHVKKKEDVERAQMKVDKGDEAGEAGQEKKSAS